MKNIYKVGTFLGASAFVLLLAGCNKTPETELSGGKDMSGNMPYKTSMKGGSDYYNDEADVKNPKNPRAYNPPSDESPGVIRGPSFQGNAG